MSAAPITELPEILYVDRHPEAKKFGKQNIAVEPKEYKETNGGGGKPQTNRKTKHQKIKKSSNLCSYTGAFKTWSWCTVFQKHSLGKLL